MKESSSFPLHENNPVHPTKQTAVSWMVLWKACDVVFEKAEAVHRILPQNQGELFKYTE